MTIPDMKKMFPCESVSTFFSTLVDVGYPSYVYTLSMLRI